MENLAQRNRENTLARLAMNYCSQQCVLNVQTWNNNIVIYCRKIGLTLIKVYHSVDKKDYTKFCQSVDMN